MRKHIVLIIVGCLFLGVGMVLTAVDIFDYKYVNVLPSNTLTQKTITYDETIDNRSVYIVYGGENSIIKQEASIPVGHIKIDVSYYSDFGTISRDIQDDMSYKIIDINFNTHMRNINNIKKLMNLGIDGLKRKKLYNYSLLFEPTLAVYINSEDIEYVKIRNY